MTSTDAEQIIDDLCRRLTTVNPEMRAAGARHHLQLTKPPGSLGALEAVGATLSAISETVIPPIPSPAAVAVFAADHGVLSEGVSPWPQEVTAQMVANFCGGGAAINAIADLNNIAVTVVNAGVASPLDDHAMLQNTPVRTGTNNLLVGPAMSRSDAAKAIVLGLEVGQRLIAEGNRCLLTGDMGIGNTTASTCIIAAATSKPAASLTGRGTGIDDDVFALKTRVIQAALDRAEGLNPSDGVGLLSELGGLEIGGIAGLCLAAAEARIPVILDGVIAAAGAVVASFISPAARGYMIAGHRSVEPASSAALEHLGLTPLLDLELRLGEGTGAALAYPLVLAAAGVMANMATFDDLGIESAPNDHDA